MIPNVARYLNKTVMVSIPALFDDRACRSFRLVGAELNGLWLQSDELIRILLPEDRRDLAYRQPVVFIPFAQIAGVLITTIAAPPANTSGTAGPGDAGQTGPGPKARSGNQNRK